MPTLVIFCLLLMTWMPYPSTITNLSAIITEQGYFTGFSNDVSRIVQGQTSNNLYYAKFYICI